MYPKRRRSQSIKSQLSDLGVNRYRLTSDEEQMLKTYRESKDVLEKECKLKGIDLTTVKHWWYKSKHISAFIKAKEKTVEDLKKELMENMAKYSPVYPKIKRVIDKESYCLVIDPADIHIGKLATKYETGEKYDSKIAVKRVHDGINKVLQYASPYSVDKIVLIIGNDILHTDGKNRTTTSGTPQDTDGQWYQNFMTAKTLYVNIIEQLMTIADVHIMYDPSNHDYLAGWYLAQMIETWFRNSQNVTFDTSLRFRKAFVYYKNLIGTTHNDGAKEDILPLLMAQEFKKEWSQTQHRYIYVHHKHHKTSKEYVGVTVETTRSPSGADGWHHKNGYQHAAQAIEAYLHHKTQGQIIRFTAVVS